MPHGRTKPSSRNTARPSPAQSATAMAALGRKPSGSRPGTPAAESRRDGGFASAQGGQVTFERGFDAEAVLVDRDRLAHLDPQPVADRLDGPAGAGGEPPRQGQIRAGADELQRGRCVGVDPGAADDPAEQFQGLRRGERRHPERAGGGLPGGDGCR
ncbi:hypothetical protein [Actinoplanes sp. NPDC020271]|uniref:hypothetical protein n=1 Tax=Actinoplanes sp. NPDC020271 TaxID=3363896 RepID=UPI0037BDF115